MKTEEKEKKVTTADKIKEALSDKKIKAIVDHKDLSKAERARQLFDIGLGNIVVAKLLKMHYSQATDVKRNHFAKEKGSKKGIAA